LHEIQRPRILVIDDDEGIRKVITTALSTEGYLVDCASTGNEAIKKSKNNFYNLALVDIRLPDMDGTRLLTAMKETTPEMRKIILTGYPALQNSIQAVNNGAHGYLVKPINMEDLLRMVEENLRKQREAKEYSQQKVAGYVETRLREIQEEDKSA
jgi:DNA-binding NtrC family response regulator